jgi:hypothetical protein
MILDPKLPFRHPSLIPPGRGLYVRDWRGTDIEPESDRALHIDLWEPVPDRRSILYPGVWYVAPSWNDATCKLLPWRYPTPAELAAFQAEHPSEWRQFGAACFHAFRRLASGPAASPAEPEAAAPRR